MFKESDSLKLAILANAIVETTDCTWPAEWIVDDELTLLWVNESDAMERTVVCEPRMALGESKLDDGLFDIRFDSETLRFRENAVVDCKVFEILSVLLRVIELETLGLTDAESFAKTLVDVEAFEPH